MVDTGEQKCTRATGVEKGGGRHRRQGQTESCGLDVATGGDGSSGEPPYIGKRPRRRR